MTVNPNTLTAAQRSQVMKAGREWLTNELRLIRFTANSISEASVRLLIDSSYPGGWGRFVADTLEPASQEK